MSDIFGKLKSGASKAAKEAEKAAKVQRIELDIGGLKRKIEDNYHKLGEMTYNTSVNPEAPVDTAPVLAAITDLMKKIEAKEEEIRSIKEEKTPPTLEAAAPPPEAGKKYCSSCGKEIEPSAKFCAECGAKNC